MIPKTIHYCWFGDNPHNDLIKKCIASWKRFLPDYKIIEWNESNIDVFSNEFMKICYEEKKWAYVSDYARLLALKNHGGFYLDTDMEVIKPFPEQFRSYEFLAGEEVDNQVSCGIIGTSPENEVINNLLKYYDNLILTEPIPLLLSDILTAENKFKDPEYYISKSEVFYPMKYDGSITDTKNSFTIHHWEGSWKNDTNTFYKNFILNKNNFFSEKEIAALISLQIDKEITINVLNQIEKLILKYSKSVYVNNYTILNIQNKLKRVIPKYINQRFIHPKQFYLSTFFEAINNPYLKNKSLIFYFKLLLKSIVNLKVN